MSNGSATKVKQKDTKERGWKDPANGSGKVSRVAHGWPGFVTFRSLWKLECLYQILSTQLAINVQLLWGWWYLAWFGGSPLKGRRIGLLTFRCLVAALWNTWCVMLSGPSPPPLSLTSLNSIGVVPVRWMKFRSGSNDSKDSNGRWIRLPPRILKLMKFEISFEQLFQMFSPFLCLRLLRLWIANKVYF